jgi:hypothetical protein
VQRRGPFSRRPATILPGWIVAVGRADELARVEAGLFAAQRGGGGLVVITGEAGIGKSWLLAETGRRAAGRGMVVLSGRAVEGGGAFRPVVEALVAAAPAALAAEERLAPYRGVLAWLLPGWSAGPGDLPVLADPIVLLGEAVIELLEFRSGGHSIVLLLDDLHWADRDTVALLGYLAGRIGRTGIFVVGAARDDEPSRDVVQRLCGTLPSPSCRWPGSVTTRPSSCPDSVSVASCPVPWSSWSWRPRTGFPCWWKSWSPRWPRVLAGRAGRCPGPWRS